jgi:Cu(I)/Ag(I) efflux system membrane protein CusA/SilA
MIPVIYTYWRYSQLKRAKRLGRPLAEIAGIEL